MNSGAKEAEPQTSAIFTLNVNDCIVNATCSGASFLFNTGDSFMGVFYLPVCHFPIGVVILQTGTQRERAVNRFAAMDTKIAVAVVCHRQGRRSKNK